MSRLTRAEAAALALVVALTAAWGGLLVWRHFVTSRAALAGPGSAGSHGPPGASLADPGEQGQTTEGPPPLVVHVAGAVKAPGVYRLDAGSRVIDAVNTAGGAADGAALDWLNLASKLADGQKVYVPSKKEVGGGQGTAASPGRAGTGAGSGGGGLAGGGPSGGGPSGGALIGGKVSLNLADQLALESLPGIGPALAQRIIAYRASHGAFQSIEELRNVSGIGERKFAEVKDLVTAP